MRPIDRILGREPAPAPSFAVRPFGTTPSDAQAAAEAAEAAGGTSGGTETNLTTGGALAPRADGGLSNRGPLV